MALNVLSETDRISTTGSEHVGSEASIKMENSALFAQMLDNQNNISLSLIRAQQRSLLPTRVPDVFSGDDVTSFGPFKMAFQQIIGNSCDDVAGKYYHLDQFTRGYARQLVRSCNCGDPAAAYEKAIKLLDTISTGIPISGHKLT